MLQRLTSALNEDVLRHILQDLPLDDLKSLSMSSRWLRKVCMPFIFARCRLSAGGGIGLKAIERSNTFWPPARLRPYIRSIAIHDNCMFWRENAGICKVYPGVHFARRLADLPDLRSLKIYTDRRVSQWHGLPWDTLHAILSTPHMREFRLHRLYFCPALGDGEELDVDSLAPLTMFTYKLDHPRAPLSFPSEVAALDAVLGKLNESLESLVLMSESAPMATLSRLRWPRLREFTLYGTPFTEDALSAPLVLMLSGMPRLRRLELNLNPIQGRMPQPLWPSSSSCSTFPWPELEHLAVSYPDPQDEVYDHLPPSMHSLSLCCWPHVYDQQFLAGARRTYLPDQDALIKSSAMLAILQRCNTSRLSELEIEYRADSEDSALLEYVARTFPCLTSLKLHRYRPAREREEVDVARIVEALAVLKQLRCLEIYLDFVKYGTVMVRDAAELFARVMGPSLHQITMFVCDSIWQVFDVVAGTVMERETVGLEV